MRARRFRFFSALAWALLLFVTCSSVLIARGTSAKYKDFSPFTFAVVSDPQIGMVELGRDRTNFRAVASAINALKPSARPSFVFITGDLVNDATNQQEHVMFEQVVKTFSMPVYVIPGNHDVTVDGKTFELSLLEKYRKSEGSDRFAFAHARCLFIGLDSELWLGSSAEAQEQFEWLKQQLRRRKRCLYVFVFQHRPLFVATADEKDQYYDTPLVWRTKLLRLFEKRKVTAVLTGHLHRNESGYYHGIAMITTPSSCLNFDGSAFGYRLVSLTGDGFVEQYAGVAGALPPNQPIDSPPTIIAAH